MEVWLGSVASSRCAPVQTAQRASCRTLAVVEPRRALDDVQQGYGRAKVLRHGPDMRDRSVAACGEIYREEDVSESHGNLLLCLSGSTLGANLHEGAWPNAAEGLRQVAQPPIGRLRHSRQGGGGPCGQASVRRAKEHSSFQEFAARSRPEGVWPLGCTNGSVTGVTRNDTSKAIDSAVFEKRGSWFRQDADSAGGDSGCCTHRPNDWSQVGQFSLRPSR